MMGEKVEKCQKVPLDEIEVIADELHADVLRHISKLKTVIHKKRDKKVRAE